MGILVSLHFLLGSGLTSGHLLLSTFLLHACRWSLMCFLSFHRVQALQAFSTSNFDRLYQSFMKINKTSVQMLFVLEFDTE